MGPLEGVKIIDMTSVLMGPHATQMMGDMGAEVIKVESPEGDPMRQVPPFRNPGMGAIFLNANHNKKSLCIDLKSDAGRRVLLQLAASADILIYNIRPKAMERLGLGYDALSAANPGLIYAGLVGYGQDGPYADHPAYDDLIQGAAGLSALLAESGDGTPRYVPTALADRVVGIHAVGVICATLWRRERAGLGQKLDIPMFEVMANLVLSDHMGGLTFIPPIDDGGYQRLLSRFRRPFKTQDGYICALVYTDKHWERFFSLIGEADRMGDRQFSTFQNRSAHIDHVYEYLTHVFVRRTTHAWMESLNELDIPAAPMHDVKSLLLDPHLAQTGFFTQSDHPSEGPINMIGTGVSWSDTPTSARQHAPRKGEHNEEVLRAHGFDNSQIEELVEQRVLIPADHGS